MFYEDSILYKVEQDVIKATENNLDFKVTCLDTIITALSKSPVMPVPNDIAISILNELLNSKLFGRAKEEKVTWIQTVKKYLPEKISDIEIELYISKNFNLREMGNVAKKKVIEKVVKYYNGKVKLDTVERIVRGIK